MKRHKPSRHAGAALEIVGATANNLKHLDVEIPLGAATLLIGVSGSGKSSLLANTLATEANTRMKRFLGVGQDHLENVEVPAFLGALPACIHFAQGAFRASQRTTVGTCSGLLQTLRRIFLKSSVPWAEPPGEPVPSPSPKSYAEWLTRHYRGRLTVSAVPLRFLASDGKRVVEKLRRLGVDEVILRSETDPPSVWEKGRAVKLSGFKPLAPQVRHILEAEIGALSLPARGPSDLPSLLDRAFAAGEGTVVVELHDAGPDLEALRGPRGTGLDSDLHWVHPAVQQPFAPPSEPLLSFNMPSSERSGACRECLGTGQALTVPEEDLIPHPERSLHAGAISLWTEKNYKYVNIQHETIEGLRGIEGFNPGAPWKKLPKSAQRLVLYGSQGLGIEDRDLRTGRRLSSPRPFEGFIPAILRRFSAGTTAGARLAPLVRQGPCPSCRGTRWSPQALALRVGAFGLADLLGAPFTELARLTGKSGPLAQAVPKAVQPLVAVLHHHARSFESVGLSHLSADRGMLTVSEGESRRVRLAGLLNASGSGLGLLLDEPARGLHEQDIDGLVDSLTALKERHTVVLNDHRLSLARAADHVIEMGPGAGEQGGCVVRNAPPAEFFNGTVLPEIQRRQLPVQERAPFLEIHGATLHTLNGIHCRIPLGRLTCITGVSGSGKSSFVRGILIPALTAELSDRVDAEGFSLQQQGRWKSIRGADLLQEVMALDQRSPDANRRSIVATYLGIAEPLRKAYAAVPDARSLGLTATDFGLNAGHGRCPDCLGLGQREEKTGWLPCSRCGGRRFGEEVLAVRLAGVNIAEALDLSIAELAGDRLPLGAEISTLFALLADLDLGYITLGRRVDQLSGGEVQRLRVAHRLWKTRTQGLFLVLDEPSAGLHPKDVERLLRVLDRIVGTGENTVLLVEHNLDLIRNSDWVVDFGPGAGPAGGKVLGQGPPEEIKALGTPTGLALRRPRKPALRKVAHKAHPPAAAGTPADTADAARARIARSWLKLLLGQDAQPAADLEASDGLEGLAIEIEGQLLPSWRPQEIGELDLELDRLFLSASTNPAKEQIERMAKLWASTPEARIVIHPLLAELQTWGPHIPASALQQAAARQKALRLETLPAGRGAAVGEIRAGGPRFQARTGNAEERKRLLSDALDLGGGFLEIRDGQGRVLGSVKTRCLDLEQGVVAPLAMRAANLSRSHPSGACPACAGDGRLPSIDIDLIVQDRRSSPDSDAFFRPEALAVIKGVRRSSMIPFFRRLAREGLWKEGRAFKDLGEEERGLLLHGYWRRPGHGSFLKDKNADPQEVASWLRWDGLFRTVLGQYERSTDSGWTAAVRKSIHAVPCLCEGTGLAAQARVVERGGKSLHDWTRTGRIGELSAALKSSPCRSESERRTLDRFLDCLAPLVRKSPEARLCEPVGDQALTRAVYERVVRSFTLLGVVP